jgi:sigma-B regulation protein RsbU (phosphoserine phosphatase)
MRTGSAWNANVTLRLLLAEDDIDIQRVARLALRRADFEVTVANNGIEALARAASARPDVILLDWMMPGLDGLELCRRVREQGGDYTYFIMLSSMATSGENLDQAISAGVDDFLAKPAKAGELKARLHVAERILRYATQVRQLQEIIPMCGYCKKMRDDKNYWSQVEEYLGEQTGTSISHGVCPDCYERVLVPQMKDMGLKAPPYPEAKRVAKQSA